MLDSKVVCPRAARDAAHPPRPWRRLALLATTLLGGCLSFGNQGQSSSCDLPTSASSDISDDFLPQCPPGADADAGAMFTAIAPDAAAAFFAELRDFPLRWSVVNSGDRSDLGCVLSTFIPYSGAYRVAVGAPFGFEYSPGSGQTLIAYPAVASLATSTPGGWVMPGPGYLDFVVSTDAGVVGSAHVLATPVTSLQWVWQVSGRPAASSAADASITSLIAPVTGDAIQIVVLPEGADGVGPVGGSIECAFASSDPLALSVQGDGLTALATALGAGEVTVTAWCAGLTEQTTLVIAAFDGGDADAADDGDGSDDDAGDDGGAVDADDADVADASDGGAGDASHRAADASVAGDAATAGAAGHHGFDGGV
jgi:hypothetical protein